MDTTEAISFHFFFFFFFFTVSRGNETEIMAGSSRADSNRIRLCEDSDLEM